MFSHPVTGIEPLIRDGAVIDIEQWLTCISKEETAPLLLPSVSDSRRQASDFMRGVVTVTAALRSVSLMSRAHMTLKTFCRPPTN